MKTTNLRVLADSGSSAAPLELSAMLKIRGTEIRQELASLARIALGPYAQPFVSEALDEDYQGAPIGPDYAAGIRSEEHTSELQSLMRISYAVFCLKKKKTIHNR